jgi:hypothetical protein
VLRTMWQSALTVISIAATRRCSISKLSMFLIFSRIRSSVSTADQDRVVSLWRRRSREQARSGWSVYAPTPCARSIRSVRRCVQVDWRRRPTCLRIVELETADPRAAEEGRKRAIPKGVGSDENANYRATSAPKLPSVDWTGRGAARFR